MKLQNRIAGIAAAGGGIGRATRAHHLDVASRAAARALPAAVLAAHEREIIVRGIEKRQARILVGSDAKVVSLLERIAPVSDWKLLKKATVR